MRFYSHRGLTLLVRLIFALALAACTAAPATTPEPSQRNHADGSRTTADALDAVALTAGEQLQVAATTSIIGDVVAQIGGQHISVTTIMMPGVDPHSYTPTPQDLRTLSAVDVIFINGLHLEEGLDSLLSQAGAPRISVNEHVSLLSRAAEPADDDHGAEDPHTWQSVQNVITWVATIKTALSALDPAHAADYQAAAATYQGELTALDGEIRTKIATIPPANRKLVTDHDTFRYFAHDYGFTIVGTVLGSLSTLAEPSAQELAALQDQIVAEQVPALFVGTTVNPDLAEQLANDLTIKVVALYSDALSADDGPAATYLAFMRYNVDAIVTALGVQ